MLESAIWNYVHGDAGVSGPFSRDARIEFRITNGVFGDDDTHGDLSAARLVAKYRHTLWANTATSK